VKIPKGSYDDATIASAPRRSPCWRQAGRSRRVLPRHPRRPTTAVLWTYARSSSPN